MSQRKKPPVAADAASGDAPVAEKVQQQVRRLLSSPEFIATDAQRAFLQFVVDKALTGKSDEIKGYTVATRVFGRREDFDQATDPVVSIHANKLRPALERYYLVAGQHDPVRIDIPKGGYVPAFHEQKRVESEGASSSGEGAATRFEDSWPTLEIRPFQNLTCDPELNHLAIGLTTELAVEITRYRDIRVLLCRPERQGASTLERTARFAIEGSVRKDKSDLMVHYALWVDWVRQEDYEQAYLETRHFGTPPLFWDPLMKAAGFGLLGRVEEGKQAVRDLLRLKPDFQSRGRTLIEHYIKFEEIVERMLVALSKVGLSIA